MSTEKQYTQAFNNGYVLAEHEPELLNIVTQNLTPANNYLQGFLAGKNQVELDNSKNQLSDLQQLRSKSQNRDKDFEIE